MSQGSFIDDCKDDTVNIEINDYLRLGSTHTSSLSHDPEASGALREQISSGGSSRLWALTVGQTQHAAVISQCQPMIFLKLGPPQGRSLRQEDGHWGS